MNERLVAYPDGTARRVPAAEAAAVAARTGGQIVDIAWDGRRGGPGGPYLSTDLVDVKPAPNRVITPRPGRVL